MADNSVVVIPQDNAVVVVPEDTATVLIVQGPGGPPGVPSLVWRGPWLSDTAYAENDVVFHFGSSYVATSSVAVNISPPVSPVSSPVAPWELLARGDNVIFTVDDVAPSNPSYGDIWISPS